MKKNNKFIEKNIRCLKQGFTLLEIVVSITIFFILSISTYMYIGKFLDANNDRIRKMHINQIALALSSINGKLPLPDNYTSLYFSGKLIGFQGTFCDTDFAKLGMTSIKDPQSGKCYTYLLNSNQDKYQLYTYLSTYKKPYIVGNDELGIITTGNKAIDGSYTGSLDLFDANETYKIYENENESFVSNTLKPIIKNCSDIKKYGIGKKNGIYNVYSGTIAKKVYCNMDIKGGGWTVVVNVADPTKNSWDGNGITDLGTSYNSGNNWIFSRTGVNSLLDDNLGKYQALIKYADGNYVILDYYSGNIQAFYNGNYAVQISSDNCIADNGRCSDSGKSSSNVSWGYFCNGKNPFFEDYTFGTGWAGSTPDKSSYDCVNKIGAFVGIR